MTRIVYVTTHPQRGSGGNKVTYRHVEALRGLGYDATLRGPANAARPTWFEHDAPSEDASTPLSDSDILVLPEDAAPVLSHCAGLPNRKVVFCQNPFALLGMGLAQLPPEIRGAYRTFMACSPGMAATIARNFDYDLISVVPAFADERLFRPASKEQVIACVPRKRPVEYRAIRYMFERLHPQAGDWRWEVMETHTEAQVAAAMGRASVFLSLARMEAVALTILEAMACECLLAGFTGVGPREYTTAINGLWVDEDDCEAAAQALVRATILSQQGGGAAALMRHAAGATAAHWTHAAFAQSLQAFWRDQMGVTA